MNNVGLLFNGFFAAMPSKTRVLPIPWFQAEAGRNHSKGIPQLTSDMQISMKDFQKIPAHKRTLLDVRTPGEFQKKNLLGAINCPLDHLKTNPQIAGLFGEKNNEIYFICRSGVRSAEATAIFAKQGYKKAKNITGGMLEIAK